MTETVATICTHATGATVTTPEERQAALLARRAELLKRAEGGEWLRTGDVATLLGISRSSAHRLVVDGTIEHKFRIGGKQRLCNPDDVLRLLNDAEKRHRGADPPAES